MKKKAKISESKPETPVVKKSITVNEVEKPKTVVKNVYSADFMLLLVEIDETIEEIKQASRRVSTNDYAANNVYLHLQNALKKVLLADK